MVRELISKVILTRTDHPRGLLTQGNLKRGGGWMRSSPSNHAERVHTWRMHTREESANGRAARQRSSASNNLLDRRLGEAVRLGQVLGGLQCWRGTPDQRRNARRCGDGLHHWVRNRDSHCSHRRTVRSARGIFERFRLTKRPGNGEIRSTSSGSRWKCPAVSCCRPKLGDYLLWH